MNKMLENLNLMKKNYMKGVASLIAAGTIALTGCQTTGGNHKTLDDAVNAKDTQLVEMAKDGIDMGDYKKIQSELTGKDNQNALVKQPASFAYSLVIPNGVKAEQKARYGKIIESRKVNFKRVKSNYTKAQKFYVDQLVQMSDAAQDVGGLPIVRYGVGVAIIKHDNTIANAYLSKKQPTVFLDEIDGLKNKKLSEIREDLGDKIFYASLAKLATDYFSSGKVKHTETPKEFNKHWLSIDYRVAEDLIGKDTPAFYGRNLDQLTDGKTFNWEIYHPKGVGIQAVFIDNIGNFKSPAYMVQQQKQSVQKKK